MILLSLVEAASQFFSQRAHMRFFDDIDVIAGNFMRLDLTGDQLPPTIVQVVIGRHIAGEKKHHVARIGLRHVILHRGEVDFFDVL